VFEVVLVGSVDPVLQTKVGLLSLMRKSVV
jgi:hypothetical protein